MTLLLNSPTAAVRTTRSLSESTARHKHCQIMVWMHSMAGKLECLGHISWTPRERRLGTPSQFGWITIVIGREIYNEVSSEDKIKLHKYFLTMECHGDVFIDDEQDQTPDQSSFGAIAKFHLQRLSLIPQGLISRQQVLPPQMLLGYWGSVDYDD